MLRSFHRNTQKMFFKCSLWRKYSIFYWNKKNSQKRAELIHQGVVERSDKEWYRGTYLEHPWHVHSMNKEYRSIGIVCKVWNKDSLVLRVGESWADSQKILLNTDRARTENILEHAGVLKQSTKIFFWNAEYIGLKQKEKRECPIYECFLVNLSLAKMRTVSLHNEKKH